MIITYKALAIILGLAMTALWLAWVTRARPRAYTGHQSIALDAAPQAVERVWTPSPPVVTRQEDSQPETPVKMGYAWHILPDDPSLHERAVDMLERGWKYRGEQVHTPDGGRFNGIGGRYAADGLPSIPPRRRLK